MPSAHVARRRIPRDEEIAERHPAHQSRELRQAATQRRRRDVMQDVAADDEIKWVRESHIIERIQCAEPKRSPCAMP